MDSENKVPSYIKGFNNNTKQSMDFMILQFTKFVSQKKATQLLLCVGKVFTQLKLKG